MLKVYVEGKIDLPRADEVCRAVAKELGQTENLYAELTAVSSQRIRKINKETRGVDAVTDVLSFPSLEGVRGKKVEKKDFPFDYDEDKKAVFIGSIVISMNRVKSQAKKFGHSEERETYYLITHALLHLFGYDHLNDADKAEMRRKEETIMDRIGIKR